ncbi:MAG: methionine sulfoxide reductase catalytic subunit [Patescibacteria group bacterium]|nr:molybdopterin-dependent oxidoreductase [Candidatus Saccharibacteria bacterium]MDQ5963777.1 methionine sulfoxide reductase catalytic subunit [Patescibacteria group bacterium]
METGLSLPILIVALHLVNLLCLILLIRSGIQILYDHPKLYWTDHTTDDNHWLRFGKKIMPKDRLWTARDEAEDPPSYVGALPGGNHNLGSGRHWHFTAALIWVITGIIYVGYLFASGQWHRIVPTDLNIFSQAIAVLGNYLTLNIPAEGAGYNALQQLTYAVLIFVLAPVQILSGLALSPALIARFPGYLRIFGNRRQIARSVHFIVMVLFSLFILVHITMTIGLHFHTSIQRFVSGNTEIDFALALTWFLMIIILLVVFNIWASLVTLRYPNAVRRVLMKFYVPVVKFVFGKMQSKQNYEKKDISPFFRVNGYPPTTKEYKDLLANDFKDWKLKVGGMVKEPLELSLKDLKKMPKQTQITKHNCIQGWTGVAEWTGVPMQEILKYCKPDPKAKYVIFYCYDIYPDGSQFYVGLRTSDMMQKQTILAYEMNGEKLPVNYGAPVRVRVEHKWGYKMAKYVKSIEFVDDYSHIGKGLGGHREDMFKFDWEASI